MKYTIQHSHPNPRNNSTDFCASLDAAKTELLKMTGAGCSKLIRTKDGKIMAWRDWDTSRISWMPKCLI